MNNADYIVTLIEDGGFSVGKTYRDLLDRFLDPGFDTVLAAYASANSRMMRDAGAVIRRFAKHAETELEGGRIIEAVGHAAGGEAGAALVRHGIDEQRHHRMFAAMARSVADDFNFEEFDIPERDPQPVIRSFAVEDGWKYLVCTIHWAEMRNIFILEQYLRALDDSTWPCATMLRGQIAAVYADELRHVGYTAELLERIVTEDAAYEAVVFEYPRVYETGCWAEIAEMSAYFAEYEPVYA